MDVLTDSDQRADVIFADRTWFGGKRFRGMMANVNQKDLLALKDLLESGKIIPAIDCRYPLREVADAITYLLGGHASGKVVITVP